MSSHPSRINNVISIELRTDRTLSLIVLPSENVFEQNENGATSAISTEGPEQPAWLNISNGNEVTEVPNQAFVVLVPDAVQVNAEL